MTLPAASWRSSIRTPGCRHLSHHLRHLARQRHATVASLHPCRGDQQAYAEVFIDATQAHQMSLQLMLCRNGLTQSSGDDHIFPFFERHGIEQDTITCREMNIDGGITLLQCSHNGIAG